MNRDTQPAPAAERRWTITTANGDTVTGHLPPWATDDPSEHHLNPAELAVRLTDITHTAPFPGQTVLVYSPANRHAHPVEEEILHGSIDCHPYAEPAEPREPVVNVHLAAECWITDLDPAGLAHLARQLRAQADRLDHTVLPALNAARTDWATHHPDAPAPIPEPLRPVSQPSALKPTF